MRHCSHVGADEIEWADCFPSAGNTVPEVLHARFVKHTFDRHTHDEYVVGLIEYGVQRFDLLRARHFTPAGSLFLINPGEAHTGGAGIAGGYVYRTLYPSVGLIRPAADGLGIGGEAPPSFGKAVITDRRLFALLTAFHRSVARRAAALEQETRLHAALSLLVSRYAEPVRVRDRRARAPAVARRAREYLNSEYMRNVSLSELASVCGLSPFYLARAFVAAFGLPPHAYLHGVRIAKAKQLIRRGEPLSEVAGSLGFCDQSHLNRRFRRIVGVTPGQYALGARVSKTER